MQKKFVVNLYWLLNHIIHSVHKLVIYESKEPYEKDFKI